MNIKWRIAQYLELFWWKRYLHNKTKADYLKWKKQYWENLFKKLENDVVVQHSDKVIDFGCGPAGCFVLLSQNKVIAVDPLIDKYQHSLSHFAKQDYLNTTFVASTIEAFNVNEQADVVLCMNAINHVNDIDCAMDVVCAAVKSGGSLVISIDAHNYSFLKWLFRLLPGDMLHPHQYNLAEYTSMIESRDIRVLNTIKLTKGFVFDYYVVVGERR
jgi:2-polyprenyl-3-methyl-5-hydroxy-6-metoxy-1,4-benzoquinol methylase